LLGAQAGNTSAWVKQLRWRAAIAELRERGIVTRQRTLSSGRTIGGVPLVARSLREPPYPGWPRGESSEYTTTLPRLKSRVRIARRGVAVHRLEPKSPASLSGKGFPEAETGRRIRQHQRRFPVQRPEI
jgi:hypothetical protein